MSWATIAERAAKSRSRAILASVRAAVTEHVPNARIAAGPDELKVSGRGLRQRWLSESGLRFGWRARP